MLSNYKKLKSDKGYIRLIVANFISTFGTSIDNIAFSWLVYELTADPIWIAVIAGASMFPMLVLQSIIAVWVERHNKKRIIIAADILGAVVMIIVVGLYLLELLNPVLLLVITLVNATIETTRIPAGIAIVPMVLSKENFATGQGLNQSLSQVASIIGLAVTGVIVATLGIYAAFIIDAVTFIISFIIILTIRTNEKKSDEKITETSRKGRFIKEYKDGLNTLIKTQNIFMICMLGVVFNFLSTAVNTYMAIFVGDYLNFSVDIYGYISIAFTVGTIIGGLTSGIICEKMSSKKIFTYYSVIQGLFYIVWAFGIFLTPPELKLIVTLISALVFGVSSGILAVTTSVAFMKAVPREYLARVGGIFNSLVTASYPIAAVLLSVLSIFMGVDKIFIIFAGMSFLFAIVIIVKHKIKLEDEEKTNESELTEITQ